MKSLAELTQELSFVKEQIQLRSNIEFVENMIKNKSKYTYTSLAGDTKELFSVDADLFGFFTTIRPSSMKDFLELYGCGHDDKHPFESEIKKAIKIVKDIEIRTKNNCPVLTSLF